MTSGSAKHLTGMLSAGTVNLVLQTITLLSKALLLFGLARYVSPSDLGVFGILVVTLNLAMYAVGLDFYAFSTRELLQRAESYVPRMLRDQLVFHGLTYVVAFPVLLLVFIWRIVPWDLAVYFYALLLLDHLAQEMQRVLITLGRPIHAASLFFLRGGLWVYPVLALMARDPAFRTVQTVALGWVVGVVISLGAGAYWLRHQSWRGTRGAVDWSWVRRGVGVGLPFLGATLAIRAVFSVDRYALQAHWGVETVGVYTFYMSIRNAIQSLLDMGVLAVWRPRIIRAYQCGRGEEYRSLMRSLVIALVAMATVLCLLFAVGIFPLLTLVGKPIYGEYLSTYWILLGVTFLAALGDVPHLGLYARQRDRAIVLSSGLGLVVAILANLALVPRLGLPGAASATAIACVVLVGGKAWFLWGKS